MTTPHPHADLLHKFADNKDLMIECRNVESRGDPYEWSAPRSPDGIRWSSEVDYRDASDWRNKFRDALERGEDVQWRTEYSEKWASLGPAGRLSFVYPEDHYRIKPKPFECWVNVYPNVELAAHADEDSAIQCAGHGSCQRVAVKMREVTDES